ncbi:CHAT domain-containing protein [Lactarius psammicola]|nr:CHAT domain-containing protein [Lactarius psammicola]
MADELGSIHEIDSEITLFQLVLPVLSRYDPRRQSYVRHLAILRLQRYILSNQMEDLDKAILHFTESLLLAPLSWLENGQQILTAFFQLTLVLLKRSTLCNQPEDVIYAAEYLRHLRHQPHTPFLISRRQVTTALVYALAFQVKLEAGNVMQNIDEMAVLCRELLMDASDSDSVGPVTLFASAVMSKMNTIVPDPPSNQVIECLRLVRKHKPDLLKAHLALASCLCSRYCTTFVNGDYEETASILDEIIISSSAGDSQGETVADIQKLVTMLALIRSAVQEIPEYSEEAIYRAHVYSGRSSDLDRYAAMSARKRFDYFGPIEGPEASSGDLPLSQPVPMWELEHIPEIGPTLKKLELLDGLLSGIHNGDLTEIDEAIKKGRNVVASAPRNLIMSIHFVSFSKILLKAFKRTNKIEYLNESISIHRQVLERPSANVIRSWTLRQLVQSLLTRYMYLPGHHMQDMDELAKLISQHANDGHVTLPHRFQSACEWAWFARQVSLHPSVSTAYESAISLMQDTLLFRTNTLQLQHAYSRHVCTSLSSMPLDYASYQIRPTINSRKRSRLLKEGEPYSGPEMRHLRTSVRSSFLQAHPQFDTLRSAASSGPVIIINHSIWRSDILILLPDTSPSLIPTPRDFYDRARALKDKLLDSRLKSRLDSGDYDRTLASVLADLYNLVGKPVIDRLCQLQVPEQSRIWWCPTSVFVPFLSTPWPDLSSLPTVGGEIQVVQALDTEVTSLISEAATPAAVIDGFRHQQFVHFACHGTLAAGKPFEAGFELYGGERLTLLEIVRSHLPTAEFAFLSACHTAEVTEGSIDDEGLHLAAAVQYCGFRSVVGTMWAMVDEDGRDLAEHFYKALFSNSRREQGISYHERSAKALQFAVKKLRRKRRITLERWVNFVHYGA